MIVQNIRERVVADAEYARDKKSNDSEGQRANRGMPKLRDRKTVKVVLYKIERLGKSNSDAAADDSEDKIVRESTGNSEIHRQDVEHRAGSEQELANAGGQCRCNDERNERPAAELEQEKLDRKNHAGDGRIERRGHSSARPAREQHLSFGRGSGNDLANQRTEGSARLNDGALGSERASRSDGDGRRNRLQYRNFRFDPALRCNDGFHRLRDAMPLDLRRTVLGHEAHDNSANNGNDDGPCAELIGGRTAKME